MAELRAAGYRVAERGSGSRWVAAGVRRGWSRLAGLLSHLAVLVVVVGVAVGSAFGSEMQLSLLPGEQALLGAPRAGFTDAVRLDRFTGEFAADGTPTRLDTEVTFLRDGAPVRESLLQVNRPGSFGGYALHPWTYGPAAHLRVTALGGQPLLDAAVALDGTLDGRAAAFVDLPSQGLTLGVQLADPAGNALSIVLADGSGTVDAVRLAPGEAARIGGLRVSHGGLDAYVTFLSRRDPGLGLVYAGGGLLVASLAVALWLPRRRATVRFRGDRVELTVRGERFDSSNAGLDMLRARLAAALGPAG